jgi:hypothetical protein
MYGSWYSTEHGVELPGIEDQASLDQKLNDVPDAPLPGVSGPDTCHAISAALLLASFVPGADLPAWLARGLDWGAKIASGVTLFKC